MPDGSSMAANARRANAIRHAGRSEYVLRTSPPRETNTTSIAMRMKKVWILLQGAMMSAAPSANAVRPSSPRRRLAESKAGSMRVAIALLPRACRRTNRSSGA